MADRLLDQLSFDGTKPLTRRHRFIRRNWKTILSLWIASFLGIVVFSVLNLSGEELAGGLWIIILINLYFLLIRLSRGLPFLGSAKEIITGSLFAVGVSYFPLLQIASQTQTEFIDQMRFAVLCFSNVLLISYWDHAIDLGQLEGKLSQRILHHETVINLLLIGQVCAGFLFIATREGVINLALLIATACLWILFLAGKRSSTDQTKFLIDAPLMVPALCFIFI